MKSQTVLDFVVFQLTPTRTRCELYLIAGDVTEKLVSGLLKPFSSHLQAVEEQLAKGGYSIQLEPPHEKSWFTKGTIERFVRFVSTPELLERVSTVEMELIQLEETVRMQTCSSVQGDDPSLIYSPSGSSVGLEKSVPSTKVMHDSIDSNETGVGENSKKELLKALDSRRMVLQKEQDMAFACAAAAGFDMVHLMELIAFSDCFGALRLREACVKFAALHNRRQEAGLWVEETDSLHQEGVPVLSNRFLTSIVKFGGLSEPVSLGNGHNGGYAKLKVDSKASCNSERSINSGDEDFEPGITGSQTILGYSAVNSRHVRAALADHDVRKISEIGVGLDHTTHSSLHTSSNYPIGRHEANVAEFLPRHSKPIESFQHWSVNHAYTDNPCVDFQACVAGVGLDGKEYNDAYMQMSASKMNGGSQFHGDLQDDHLPAESRCLTQRSPSGRQRSPSPCCKSLQIWQGGLKHSGTVATNNINYIAPSAKNGYQDQQEHSSIESGEGARSSSDGDDMSGNKSKVILKQVHAKSMIHVHEKNMIDMSEIRGFDICQNFGETVMERWIDSPIFNTDCKEKPQKCDGRLDMREVEALDVKETSLLYGKERNGDSGELVNYVLNTKSGTHGLNQCIKVQNSLAVVAPNVSSDFLRSTAMPAYDSKDQLVTQDPEVGFSSLLDHDYIKQETKQGMMPFDDSFCVSSYSSAREKLNLEGTTTLSVEAETQGIRNQDLMVKDKMKGNSILLNQEEPHDLLTVSSRKKESGTGSWNNAANLDIQLLSGIAHRQSSNHDVNLNTPSKEHVKRFLDRYNEKREAKRREESSSKRAERETKMKAIQDFLEKQKSEMSTNHRLEKASSLAEARLRAEKLRAYKAGLQKSKNAKEEEEKRRLEDLKIRRRERIAARSSSSIGSVSSTLQGHRFLRPQTIHSPANQLSPGSQKAAAPVKSSQHGSSQLSSKQKGVKAKESSAIGLPSNPNRLSSIGVLKTSKIPLRNSSPSVTGFPKELGRNASSGSHRAVGLPPSPNRSSSIGFPKTSKFPLRNSAPSVTGFPKEVGRNASSGSHRAVGLSPSPNRSSSIGVPKTSKLPLRNSAPSVTGFPRELGRNASSGSHRTIQTRSINRLQNSISPRDGFSSVSLCRIEGKRDQVSRSSVMTRRTLGTEVKGLGLCTVKDVKDLYGMVRQQRVASNSPEIKESCRAFLKKGSGAASVARNVVTKPKAASAVRMVKQHITREREGSPGTSKNAVTKPNAASPVKMIKQHVAQEREGSLGTPRNAVTKPRAANTVRMVRRHIDLEGHGSLATSRNAVTKPKAVSAVRIVKQHTALEEEGSPGTVQTVKVVTRQVKEKGPLFSLVKTQINEKEITRVKKKDQLAQIDIFRPGERDGRPERRHQLGSVRANQQSAPNPCEGMEEQLSISVANDKFGKADKTAHRLEEGKEVQPCVSSAAMSLSPDHDMHNHSSIDAGLGSLQVKVSYQEMTCNRSNLTPEKSAPVTYEEVDPAPVSRESSDPVLEDAAICDDITSEVSSVFDMASTNPSGYQWKWESTSRNRFSFAESAFSVKEHARGLKRLLRFGRRSTHPSSKYGIEDRILVSTTSEGDEDGRKTNAIGNTLNLSASLNNMNFYSESSLDFQGSRKALPRSHSFFSFASFRSKGSERKSH